MTPNQYRRKGQDSFQIAKHRSCSSDVLRYVPSTHEHSLHILITASQYITSSDWQFNDPATTACQQHGGKLLRLVKSSESWIFLLPCKCSTHSTVSNPNTSGRRPIRGTDKIFRHVTNQLAVRTSCGVTWMCVFCCGRGTQTPDIKQQKTEGKPHKTIRNYIKRPTNATTPRICSMSVY
jgi:hypothetical protein